MKKFKKKTKNLHAGSLIDDDEDDAFGTVASLTAQRACLSDAHSKHYFINYRAKQSHRNSATGGKIFIVMFLSRRMENMESFFLKTTGQSQTRLEVTTSET